VVDAHLHALRRGYVRRDLERDRGRPRRPIAASATPERVQPPRSATSHASTTLTPWSIFRIRRDHSAAGPPLRFRTAGSQFSDRRRSIKARRSSAAAQAVDRPGLRDGYATLNPAEPRGCPRFAAVFRRGKIENV